MQLSTLPQFLNPRMVAMLIGAALAIAAVVAAVLVWTGSDPATTESAIAPAVVEHIEDSELSRITLSERAAERLNIQTDTVSVEGAGATSRMTVPYAAVYYSPDGQAWVYTNPEPLVFARHAITIDRIEGDTAFLMDGPPAETAVVTVGVAELYGTEFEIGH